MMIDRKRLSRRKVIKAGMTALAAVPLVGLTEQAFATQNTPVRTALKFQDHPNGDKRCLVCINFIPNKDKPNNDDAVNGCKMYPGDTEICSHCFCLGFVQNAAATAAGAAWSPWAPPAAK
jgi:hypothetical protein